MTAWDDLKHSLAAAVKTGGSSFRFILQYLLIPVVIAYFGFSLNRSLEQTKQELQQITALQIDRESSELEQRIEAYGDFFESIGIYKELNAARARAAPEDNNVKELELSYLKLNYDARFRMVVYGKKPVIETLAKFWREYRVDQLCSGSRAQWVADAAIYQAIRHEVFAGEPELDPADINALLWDCQMPAE